MACIESAYDKGACVGSICVGSTSAVKHSEMHLQSFQILEVKLFDT